MTFLLNAQYTPRDNCGVPAAMPWRGPEVIERFLYLNKVFIVDIAASRPDTVAIDHYPDFIGHAANANIKGCPHCGQDNTQWTDPLGIHPNAAGQERLLAGRARARRRQGGLPKFIIREFEEYLRCGLLSEGCFHLACRRCGYSLLVALSCKRRGFCPACLGRRMSDTAVHLEQRVLPAVPIRHWICSLPWGLRALLGYDHSCAPRSCEPSWASSAARCATEPRPLSGSAR